VDEANAPGTPPELGLKPTFSTWSQVTMLHLYVIAARIRGLPRVQAGVWQQHLLDHFFYDAENRMETRHHMHSGGVRKKYLRDLFVQWRGLLCAYDEGLVRGDAVLAAAIWRNIFKADEDVDIKNLALIVSYVRRTLRSLDAVSDDTLMAGLVKFGSPVAELSVVTLRSQMMDVKLTDFEGCES
jgi:cytochrome b pre-mRNA-processing protein 3